MKEKGYLYTRDLPDVPEMVFIPTGEVWLGSENFSDSWNRPMVKIKIDAFYISKYEITRGQYYNVVGIEKPSEFENNKNKPSTTSISSYYYDVQKDEFVKDNERKTEADRFIEKLSEITKVKFDLPTEAQWNRAARGDSKKDFLIDKDKILNRTNIGKYYYLFDTNLGSYPVGFNEADISVFGVYDMYSNKSEIVRDIAYRDFLKDIKNKKIKGKNLYANHKNINLYKYYVIPYFDIRKLPLYNFPIKYDLRRAYLNRHIVKGNDILNYNYRNRIKNNYLKNIESDLNRLYYGIGHRYTKSYANCAYRVVASENDYKNYLKKMGEKK
jgi:hypothetical protein